MISARRLRFAWPTVESTWDEIVEAPQLAPFLAWKGKLWGEVAVRLFLVLAIVTWVPLMLVPIPRVMPVYGGDKRGLFVRWLLWQFYIGPKPPTIVVVGPMTGKAAEGESKWMTDEELLALIKDEEK